MMVVVLQPHTHAGVDYPPGSVLDLPEDSAVALIARGAARAAAQDEPKPTDRKRNRKGD